MNDAFLLPVKKQKCQCAARKLRPICSRNGIHPYWGFHERGVAQMDGLGHGKREKTWDENWGSIYFLKA